MTTKTIRTLPADVYDYLEFSAWAFGGVGGDSYNETEQTGDDPYDVVRVPCCVYGHAMTQPSEPAGSLGSRYASEATLALISAGIMEEDNDNAVRRVNARRGLPLNTRIPFADWAKELNVVRGDA